MIKLIVEFMDGMVDSVEELGSTILYGLVKPFTIVLIELFIAMAYPLWIVPYKIFRKTDKNQKSAEAYASEGEEKC